MCSITLHQNHQIVSVSVVQLHVLIGSHLFVCPLILAKTKPLLLTGLNLELFNDLGTFSLLNGLVSVC